MKKLFVFLFIVIIAACNANPTPADVEAQLKSTMTDYLYKERNYDSAKVKYEVKKMYYYEEPTRYICEFQVKMTPTGYKDTTGYIKAYISKDFKKVERRN